MWRQRASVGLLAFAMAFSGLAQLPANADVVGVTGSAYGFFTSVSLFGGPAGDIGPVPIVTLPPGGSASPITASDTDGEAAVYGPAVIVETATMEVSTEGTTGANGSVTSSSEVTFPQPKEEQVDPFNADDLTASCTADATGTSGSTTLTNASLVTKTDEELGMPVETIDIPADPEPNATFGGTIDNVGDSFRIVFNEQVEEDGVLTVNAVHLYFGQNAEGEPIPGVAVGDAIIGQVVCGAESDGNTGSTSTTTDPGGSTTVPECVPVTTIPGETTTSTAPCTSTTLPGGSTTTFPEGPTTLVPTSTTVPPPGGDCVPPAGSLSARFLEFAQIIDIPALRDVLVRAAQIGCQFEQRFRLRPG